MSGSHVFLKEQYRITLQHKIIILWPCSLYLLELIVLFDNCG